MTEEQREKKRAYDRAYRAAYYKANKEKIIAQTRAYSKENKESILAKKKIYYEANKENKTAYNKAYHESHKDGYYSVYYIHKENYVGMTINLDKRIRDHKGKGKDVSLYTVIKKFKTKREALDCERFYHDLGYNGAYGWQRKTTN